MIASVLRLLRTFPRDMRHVQAGWEYPRWREKREGGRGCREELMCGEEVEGGREAKRLRLKRGGRGKGPRTCRCLSYLLKPPTYVHPGSCAVINLIGHACG